MERLGPGVQAGRRLPAQVDLEPVADFAVRQHLEGLRHLDHRAQRLLVHDALLPGLRPPNHARRIRLPSSAREWTETEISRRVDGLRDCGALVHGDLDDLASPPIAVETLPRRTMRMFVTVRVAIFLVHARFS